MNFREKKIILVCLQLLYPNESKFEGIELMKYWLEMR